MRILIVTMGSLLVLGLIFLTVKFWGQGQGYIEYKHPLYQLVEQGPYEFVRVRGSKAADKIAQNRFLYIEAAITADQKLVAVVMDRNPSEKSIRYSQLSELTGKVIDLTQLKDQMKNKIILFNLVENAQAVHENFYENVKELGMEKGDNFIVMSPYEAPVKALKEKAPAFLYGSTQPEILRIVAMQSMYLLEATTIRADVIVHPLRIRNLDFYNEGLQHEFKRRFKKIIVGPVLTDQEKAQALALKPYGMIVD